MQESSPNNEDCEPARTAAPYVGGKRNLARAVIARLRPIPHATYAEPFVGMGGIFLRRPWRAKSEVINDLSADVANFFRVLQRHYVPFMDMLRWQLTSRAEFDRLLRAVPDTLTDLERAARFLYLQRVAFGGKVEGRNFGVSVGLPGRFDVTRLGPILDEVHQRLAGVIIERLPYAELLQRYDRPDTLFYCDPPYWGSEGYYGPIFTREDFAALAAALGRIKGRFVLSINDVPEVRRIFAGFQIEPVGTHYGIGSGQVAARELLISGGGRAR